MTDTDGHGRLRCRWAVAGRHAPLGQDVPRTVGERARARPWEEQGTEGNSLSSLLHGARGTLIGSKRGCLRWRDKPTREGPSLLVHLDSESVTVRFTQCSGCLCFLRSRPTHGKDPRSRMRSPCARRRRLQGAHVSVATACGHRSHREPNPRCARRLCPRWVNSSKCGKPHTCHCLFDLQGLCEAQTCPVS
jgi:hypothetical protein